MSVQTTTADYGVETEPLTLRVERRLPGPVDRVWAYLTDSEKRGKWLAAGPMELKPGGAVELTWRNDELSPVKETRPARFAEAEHRMSARVTRCEPPRVLAFTWGEGPGEVTFELFPEGDEVRLVLTHARLSGRAGLRDVASGWHAHLDILGDVLAGRAVRPFWANWTRLEAEYGERLAG